jgi:hypothetical protein
MNKPKRTQSRIGDIFEVRNGKKKEYRYFQFCALDYYQLNSDVIAVFEGLYDKPQDVETVVSKPVEFFTHTSVRYGVPEFYTKVGKAELVDYSGAIFKIESNREKKEADAESTKHWQIWLIGDEDPKYVGKYKKVPPEAELGLVFWPGDIPYRVFNGIYKWDNSSGGTGYFGVER